MNPTHREKILSKGQTIFHFQCDFIMALYRGNITGIKPTTSHIEESYGIYVCIFTLIVYSVVAIYYSPSHTFTYAATDREG